MSRNDRLTTTSWSLFLTSKACPIVMVTSSDSFYINQFRILHLSLALTFNNKTQKMLCAEKAKTSQHTESVCLSVFLSHLVSCGDTINWIARNNTYHTHKFNLKKVVIPKYEENRQIYHVATYNYRVTR